MKFTIYHPVRKGEGGGRGLIGSFWNQWDTIAVPILTSWVHIMAAWAVDQDCFDGCLEMTRSIRRTLDGNRLKVRRLFRLFDGIVLSINCIIRLTHGINRLINGSIRLINVWGPVRAPGPPPLPCYQLADSCYYLAD